MKTTLDEAIKILKANYEKAKRLSFVRQPVSWALYYTWQEVDKKENREK